MGNNLKKNAKNQKKENKSKQKDKIEKKSENGLEIIAKDYSNISSLHKNTKNNYDALIAAMESLTLTQFEKAFNDEDDKNKENININEENKENEEEQQIKESTNKEEDINKDKIENAKNERRIRIVKDDRKISQRITVEETRIKSKKADFIESIKNKSVINSQTADGMEKSIKIKTKAKLYRKHCRLEIPICEEEVHDSYNINEPYGYIEIRFNCEKDKQEEYFRNKQLVIELDK